MEYILEFIVELIVDGSFYLSKDKRVPKYLRYLLIAFMIILISSIIFGIIILGFILLSKSIIIGIIFMILGLLLGIGSIIKFKQIYLDKLD